jgi:putative colanic acid biosynthesis acetyltransferase WcaB
MTEHATERPMPGDGGFAGSWPAFRRLAAADWRANPRDYKARSVLLGFRLAQRAMGTPERLRLRAVLPVLLYRTWTEWALGLELRPKTRVGGGLTIYHGFALTVNDHTVIGSGVTVRNSVTIGNRTPGGGCPVIGDGVEFGAGAIVIGDIVIGAGARIGAGAVVVKDVRRGAAVVGNPAREVGVRA